MFKEWLKMTEMGSGPYIGNCTDTHDYQVIGACSDQNSATLNDKYRDGKVSHKEVRSKDKKWSKPAK